MSKKWEELTEEFDAVSDDGQQFHMQVFTMMIDMDMNAAPLRGLKRVCTSHGQSCNGIDDDTFVIIELGMQVKRI